LVLKNQELNLAYSELDKFAYSVSHDIRGPLAGILTGIDYLQYSEDLGEIKDLMKTMKKSLLQLDDYIIAMHQYYNQQKGQIHIEQVNFHDIVQEKENIFAAFALSNTIFFNSQVDQIGKFSSDVISIKLIINNLLSNAFKYQNPEEKEKKVELNIAVKNGIATIIVIDNGIGIAENDIEKIFDLHFRSTNSGNGFGFGLYNLKGALLKLSGQIEVQSKIGEGTKVKITLPSL
jgi:signal transduction histidine kinase